MMNAEIATRKVGSKWHGYIGGRPDLDETALTEEAARRKAERLNFPTRAEIEAPFAGWEVEAQPLWGRMPDNSYLFVFRKRV